MAKARAQNNFNNTNINLVSNTTLLPLDALRKTVENVGQAHRCTFITVHFLRRPQVCRVLQGGGAQKYSLQKYVAAAEREGRGFAEREGERYASKVAQSPSL